MSQSSTFITITHKPSFYANNSSSVTGSLTLQHSPLDSICVCREVHKFLLALHWCRSAVEIFLGDYHTTIMLSRESGMYCVHTLKHHNTLNICSRYIKGVLCRRSQSCSRDYPQPPPTQLSEDLNSVYLYNYYQEGSNMGHLVARAGAQIHNRWEN